MKLSRKLLLLPVMMLLLSACATAEPRAQGYIGVPLPEWTAVDQWESFDKILLACGSHPVVCPRAAVLERAVLDYVKLRAEVQAAGAKP